MSSRWVGWGGVRGIICLSRGSGGGYGPLHALYGASECLQVGGGGGERAQRLGSGSGGG